MNKLVPIADEGADAHRGRSAFGPALMRPERESGAVRPDVKRLGQILIEDGKLSDADVERVVRLQSRSKLSFGAAAMRLGLITERALTAALARQFNYHFVPAAAAAKVGIDHKELVTASDPFGARAEGFRALRTQLMLRWFAEGQKTLAVVSPAPGDGRSYVAANLAVVFSQLGANTILIDADYCRPKQHAIFGLSNSVGLSSILAGHRTLPQVGNLTVFQSLSVLPSGPMPPNRQELLESRRFLHLLDQLEETYEVVLIDTSPAQESTSAQTAALWAGGAVVLCRKDRTRVKDMMAVNALIGEAGAQIVGTVFNQR